MSRKVSFLRPQPNQTSFGWAKFYLFSSQRSRVTDTCCLHRRRHRHLLLLLLLLVAARGSELGAWGSRPGARVEALATSSRRRRRRRRLIFACRWAEFGASERVSGTRLNELERPERAGQRELIKRKTSREPPVGATNGLARGSRAVSGRFRWPPQDNGPGGVMIETSRRRRWRRCRISYKLARLRRASSGPDGVGERKVVRLCPLS